MAKIGAVARRGEDYGIVVELSKSNFDDILVEWDDGSTEWVTVSQVEWVVSGE